MQEGRARFDSVARGKAVAAGRGSEGAQWHHGVLGMTDIVRGAALSANRSVRLPNYGDLQMHSVSPVSADELLVFMCACQVMSAAQQRWKSSRSFCRKCRVR